MGTVWWVLLVALPLVVRADSWKNYTGHQIVQIQPRTDEQLQVLGRIDDYLGFEIDVLRGTNQRGSHSELLVPPGKIRPVLTLLNQQNITHEIVVPDVGAVIAKSRRQRESVHGNPSLFNPFFYYSFHDQMKYIEDVAARRWAFVQSFVLGESFEKREMKYLKIGFPSRNFKPAFLIDAGIHAREWIAPATALYIIHTLTNNRVFEQLLHTIDIYVMPNVNPDGYEYSRNRDRLWRKTRSGPRNGCYGVDGNRNFPYFYAYDGTSKDPCSDIYHGTGPLSEPETSALARFMQDHRSTLRAYVTLHSYGGNILYPWGYKTKTYTRDVDELHNVGRRMAAAIQRVRGTQYKVGQAADALYPAAGASDDYAKSIGIKYVYTMELRPTETEKLAQRGFELPVSEIRPTVVEAFEGILELANIIKHDRSFSSPRPRLRSRLRGNRRPRRPAS